MTFYHWTVRLWQATKSLQDEGRLWKACQGGPWKEIYFRNLFGYFDSTREAARRLNDLETGGAS